MTSKLMFSDSKNEAEFSSCPIPMYAAFPCLKRCSNLCPNVTYHANSTAEPDSEKKESEFVMSIYRKN